MKVTVLGFWGGFPHNGEGTTSYLVESKGFSLLLDAGSSTLIQLEKKIDPLKLDAVILTHYHHDHIADLGVLQYLRQLKPKEPVSILPIYGHEDDQEHFQQLSMTGISEGFAYNPNEKLEIGPFEISFIQTIHPVTCYAMRIEEKETGKIFVFTADTGYFDGLVEFCREADLLITDTYFLEGTENHHAHLSSKETGVLAKEAGVKKLVLSHLRQEIDLNQLKEQTEKYHNNSVETILASTLLNLTV
ncbi:MULTISPECIES: MBL fold metallo-hydrolase [Vagococcus]|uniref:Metal-dependent hydrolases of the beta-lactamase superfamily I PhnP protein n=1 Tax=Vagococcus fluvialis bH819 TaxID=1255619 RepID=A0A1X6WPC1_9ENTE|nr:MULTISPECIES: MBL fold metallo-hydrolase [Vagococcus]SLM86107.1 Metal-dependent hydrolases of the beta-lactamase superfamily I; PhnP protein [Vagococcus fluvialis bH819]HCM90356.1 MBL fold metallo-hydrolase [Vagococcus sp.]